MPTWINSGSGDWDTGSNWSGGYPNSAGAEATFVFTANPSAITISLADASIRTIGILNVTLAGSAGLAIQGTGPGIDRLMFWGGAAGNATVNYSGAQNFSILPTNGLRVELRSDTVFNNSNPLTGGILYLNAITYGDGALIKAGTGKMVLGNSNSFVGGIEVQRGLLEYDWQGSLGSGDIILSNDAGFMAASSTTVTNDIATISGANASVGSARIGTLTGTTLTLTGTLSHLSQGNISFGFTGYSGTVVADFSSILENATNSSYTLASGTLRFGDAYNAANLLDRPGGGLTSIFGTLDTAGYATRISNLYLGFGSTLRATSGVLDVTVDYIYPVGLTYSGAIIGTAGIDQLIVNVSVNFDLNLSNFSSWSANDILQIIGSSANNNIRGSSQGEQIVGLDGNDTLTGNGGVDTISGGGGTDLVVLYSSGAGSFIDGGSGTDTLRLEGGGQYGLGAFSGFEAVELYDNSVLILTGAQFSTGLSSNASVGGDGAIQVDLSLGNQTMIARGMTATGAGFTFAVNGSSGIDVVKVALNSPSAIEGFAGNDQLVGSDQADYIDGGADVDKIRGDGGGDFLFGGAGADVFKFRKITDSGIGANADNIADFLSGADRLNFARIDTNAGLAGDQGFAYIGNAAFSAGGAAQIRWVDLGADLRVEADVNGDGIADMHVLLQGAGAQTLTAADFVL